MDNTTLFYLFEGGYLNTGELRREICDTLGGIAWVDIRVYDMYMVDPYQANTRGQIPVTPVKITSTDEAHVLMTLAFSEQVIYTKEFVRGGVVSIIKAYNSQLRCRNH